MCGHISYHLSSKDVACGKYDNHWEMGLCSKFNFKFMTADLALPSYHLKINMTCMVFTSR